jgi:hypothetical protein
VTTDDFFQLPEPLTENDRLFADVGPWEATAPLNWDFLGEYRYVEGFKRAAEVLSEHVLEHRSEVDLLVMPVLFGFRHWAELRLKDLWMLGGRLRGESVDPMGTHDLKVLWRHVRPVLEEAWPTGDPAELDRLGDVLTELAEADPRAEAFRYARDRAGNKTLPAELAQINVHNVRQVMEKVALLLDGAAIGLEELLSWGPE